jgi:peroxiredoxin
VADLDGRPRALGEWSQRLLVVNFWASWCAPCLEEIPLFVTAQSRHGAKGLQIVGIAADSVSNARIFAEKLQINYPILADEAAAISISKRFGNRLGLLPFSIVLAPSGDILTTKLGVFTAAEIDQLVENHLRQSH